MICGVWCALSFQGVDLSNIIKEAAMSSVPDMSRSKLTLSLDNIGTLMKEPTGKEKDIIKELQAINDECDKSIAHRVFAGSLGAYSVLVDVMEKFQSVSEVASEALSTITALMSGNPDLLDRQGIEIIINYLDNQKSVDIQKKVLEWAKVCCIRHEQNRQDIFRMKILPRLKTLLHSDAAPVIVREVCGVTRALVLDDDIRVQYGRSHDHAKELALEILCALTDLLKSKLVSSSSTSSSTGIYTRVLFSPLFIPVLS
jgi:hypothetical protein